MSLHGKLVDVTTRRVGVEAVAASTGVTVAVEDAGPLGEAGGALTLYGQPVEYVAADLEAETVTLTAPLVVEAGDRLELAPAKVETVATVRVDDDDEAVSAIVPLSMRMRLPEGVRDNPDTSETVLLDWVGNSLEVTDVVGDDGHVKTQWPIAPGGAFISGDPDGRHTELNDVGFYAYLIGPDGIPYARSWITSDDTSISVADETGTVLGGINSMGDISGRKVTANQSLSVGGLDMLGTLGGGSVPGWLDNLARGIVPGGIREIPDGNTSAVRGTGVEIASYTLAVNLLPGRRYKVGTGAQYIGNVADSAVRVRVRYATGTNVPTTSSPRLGRTETAFTPTPTFVANVRTEAFFSVDVAKRVTFMMTFEGILGATPQRVGGTLYVEDVGPLTTVSTGSDDDGAGSVEYTTTWAATAAQRYDKDGAAIPGSDGLTDLWYWFGDPLAIENAAVLFGGGAVESTDAGEVGKTITAAQAGATLIKAEIYIHNKTWYSDAEGHTVLGSLGAASLPSSKSIDGTLYVPRFPAGSGVWVEVPVAWFTGTNRGVTLGDKDGFTLPGAPPAATLTSGAMHGVGDPHPPLFRATYSR